MRRLVEQHFPSFYAGLKAYRRDRIFRSEAIKASVAGLQFKTPHAPQASESFEPNERCLADRLLSQVELFVDIGANVGLYTLTAASHGIPAICFEPDPDNLRYLYENITANALTNVEVFPLALSNAGGVKRLYGGGTAASLTAGWAGAPLAGENYSVCPSTVFDAVMGERLRGKRVLVKIDVEGHEFEVLSGASASIALNDDISWMVEVSLTEHHPSGLNRTYRQTFDVFLDAGYRVFAIGKELTEVDSDTLTGWMEQKHCPFIDFLFAKPGATARLNLAAGKITA